MSTLQETPLAAWHRSHGAKMGPFAGWDMPIQYAGILAEHAHTRTSASVFDICHMGEFIVQGEGATEALGRAVSHNLATLAEGKCRYGFLLTEQGTVLDDLIIYRLGEHNYMLVVNGACAASDFATLKSRLPATVLLEDISAATAKIDLQGPLALDVLEKLMGKSFRDLGYFAYSHVPFADGGIMVSRTGYTGELGYELYLPWENALELWEALLSDPRVMPAGLGARDTLRLEAGLPLYGHELDTEHSPAEAGMGKMLTSTADYVGKSGAQQVRQELVPLIIEGRRAVRNGDRVALTDGGPSVGIVTSGSFAPSLGYVVAFAWVDAAHAKAPGFVVQAARVALPARPASVPFYAEGTARKKLV